MGSRKLTAEELAGVEELPAAAPTSRKLSAEELAGAEDVIDPEMAASAAGRPSDVPGASATPREAEKPGFVARALTQIGEGIGHIGAVAATQGPRLYKAITSPVDSLHENWSPDGIAQNTAERKELLRGVDDVFTLGHGQRFAARVGNALGDAERGTTLDETKHFSPDPLQDNVDRGPSKVQAAEQKRAPDVRPAAQLVSSFAPINPVSRLAGAVGTVGGAALTRAAPQAVAKVLQVAKAVPAPLAVPASHLAAYESTAPLAAGLSADAEGHRLEAAGAGATDPMGVLLTLGGGAAGHVTKEAVLGSEGAKARRFIEERGNGAEVGLRTPGSGGVFDAELAGLPANDRGIGIAGKRGANAIIDNLEQTHADTHGYDYRGGPELERQAARDVKDTSRSASQDMRQAGRDASGEIQRAERDAREFATEQAPTLLSALDERHRVEGSEPYRVLAEQIDGSPAARAHRDASPIVSQMQDAIWDLSTPADVRAQLQEQLGLLERYRSPISGAVLVPERQLNGLRRNLMDLAKIGTTDAPRGHDAPLRQAAFTVKDMVDQGPYAALNQLYAESASARESGREALGLPGRLGRDRAVEERKLKGQMVRSVRDPSVMPAEAPPEASMAPYRQRMDDARANLGAVRESAETRQRGALADQAATRDRVAAGAAAAVPDRRLLGLGERIGPRKTDVNQTKLALMREAEQTKTAGGNPSDLAAFRAAHPELALNIDLPALQSAKADLSFSPAPVHGGIMERTAGGLAGPIGAAGMMAMGHGGLPAAAMIGLHQALVNRKAIQGRVLYTPAKKLNPVAIAKALGVSRGVDDADDLGAKVKAAIEAKKMEQRQ